MKSELKKVPIENLCIGIYDGPHATPPKSDSGAVFLGISNFSNGRLDLSNIRYISENDLPKWTKRVTPKAHDIVFSYTQKEIPVRNCTGMIVIRQLLVKLVEQV